MAPTVFAPPLGPEFDPFLYAFIGEDPNGMTLSVLSAFARSDVDPWKEAAHLARMSPESATIRLGEFIAALPNRPNANVPSGTIAGQLIALLPAPAVFVPPLPDSVSLALSHPNSRFAASAGIALLLFGLAYFFWSAPRSPTNMPAAAPSERNAAPPSEPSR